jgi:MFS family permease
MPLHQSETFPEDPDYLPPARRRRARRILAPLDVDERSLFLDHIARRTSPSFDFFLFSATAGLIMGTGLLFDSPALLILGAVFAPVMAPITGIALGTVVGSVRHFLRSLIGFLIGSLLVFIGGLITGLVGGILIQSGISLKLNQAYYHAQISWAGFLVLAVGAGLTMAAMSSNEKNAAAPSVALAYELYLPLAVAGFGFASRQPHLWPDGLVVFALHLACGTLVSIIVLAILGFRPLTLFGYTVSGAIILAGVVLLIGLSSAGAVMGAKLGLPTAIPTSTLTFTPTLSPTLTPIPPSETPTPTITRTPIPTATRTFTPSPTPIIQIVAAPGTEGILLRAEPGGAIIKSYLNGIPMEILPDDFVLDGVLWQHVIAPDGIEGWILQSLLATPTTTP